MTEFEIAEIAHEVNRAYCESLGDQSQVTWEQAPDWQRSSALNGVRLHLDNPQASASASHDAWSEEKIANGWVYGAEKDPDKMTHPCLVAFGELPREQQAKDFIFRGVVNALRRFV